MWKTTVSAGVWRGPAVPSAVGGAWARPCPWGGSLGGPLVLCPPSWIPLDFFGLLLFFQGSCSWIQSGVAARRSLGGDLWNPRLCKLCANNKDPRGLFRTVACPAVLDLNIPAAVRSSPLVTALRSSPASWRGHFNSPKVSELALANGSVNNSVTESGGWKLPWRVGAWKRASLAGRGTEGLSLRRGGTRAAPAA